MGPIHNPIYRELRELAGVAPLTSIQVACGLGYVATLVLLGVTETYAAFTRPKDVDDAEKQEEKETLMSKKGAQETASRSFVSEFLGSGLFKCLCLDSRTLLTNREYVRAAAEFGTLMAWFFVADRTSMLPVGTKSYTRDTFFFVYLILVIYSFSTWKREWKTPVFLNRHQTEEWKGWMQVLFLLYHYFEARELYNGIRILIAAYVWMTGFGNFLYYRKTRDFCLGRFAEMMWRLNFLVLFCCMVLNNSYMLYYICPMHTLFTIFVYASLAIFPTLNDNNMYLLGKIIFCVGFVYCMWDVKSVFYSFWKPFGPLVTYDDPRRPSNDNLHEWYFRSGLDRYVWIYGMLCGYMHPYVDEFLAKVDSMPQAARYSVRMLITAAAIGVGTFWYQNIYVLPKLEYNKLHPFTSWIPITIWCLLRNITPRLRVASLGVFGWLGCITLETYIGQFHTWLSSSISDGQPTGLLVLVPNYPLINFALVSAVYVFVSHRLFLLTNKLKIIAIPGRDRLKVLVNIFVMCFCGFCLWIIGLSVSAIIP